MKNFWQEFKKFITRGNVIDMAVGVVVATAFTAIVNAIVNNILMPIVTMAVPAGLDGLVTVLNPEKAAVTEATVNTISYWGTTYDADVVNVINWGILINAVINFFLIALILFIILKVFTTLNNKRKALLKKEEEEQKAPAPEPKPSEEVLLLREIRDSLKNKESK